jgi:tetrahydromethanopterin S-methyltransferase subunit H
LAGADFIIYGPLRASTYVFEAAAVVEGIKAYGKRLGGEKVMDRNHPLYKFLPRLM